jgi:hypothetical protein
MEALNNKRARLRRELQEAYSAWMATSEFCATSETHVPVDISGCPDTTKVKWFEYLAAKERLVLAYAEQPVAA